MTYVTGTHCPHTWQIQTVQLDTDRLRSQVEDAGKRAKNEVNQAFQQLCALLEKRKTAMISQIQSDVNEQVGILTDMCSRYFVLIYCME